MRVMGKEGRRRGRRREVGKGEGKKGIEEKKGRKRGIHNDGRKLKTP